MLTLPIPLLINWLVGLFSLALLAGGILLLYRALRKLARYSRPARRDDRSRQEPAAKSHIGNTSVAPAKALSDPAILTPLIVGFVLLLLSFAGRHIVKLAFPIGREEPTAMRTGTVQTITRPDGTKIHAELYGPPDAPALILTHGWGTNSTEWYYAKRHLSDRFRLILWIFQG
jgi:hypothetical protein